MKFTSKIDHESSIGANIIEATHKWKLPFWSVLSEYYANGITSAEFDILQGENCKCLLKFWPDKVQVQFIGGFQYHSLRARVSFVDENMKKLFQISCSTTSEPNPDELLLNFGTKFTDTSIAPHLQDDTLIVYFELWIIKAINECPVMTNTWQSNFDITKCEKLEELFENGQFSDVTFVVQDKKLTAHKLILSANSDAFEAMFTTEMKEGKEGLVIIEDVDSEVFEKFLRYMYTRKVEDIADFVTELIVVANKYQVIDLVKLCETYMKSHLSIDNATRYLRTAHQIVCSSLEDKAIELLKGNMKILADAAEFKLLSNYPSLINRIFG